jgi:hypothetical protein
MAQVNLQVFNHIGQKFPKLESLASQIGTCILERIIDKKKKPLTEKENKQILNLFQENANRMIEKSGEEISKLKGYTELGVPQKLVYSYEEEKERFQCFLKVLENISREKVKRKIIMLPSWSEIKEKTGNYFIIREMLRRRSNQSTWSRLKECGFISRPPSQR